MSIGGGAPMGRVIDIRGAAIGEASPSVPRGYLGLTERQIEVDWNTVEHTALACW